MLMISKEAMNSVMSLKEKISDRAKESECIAALENMIKIKQSHLSRAEWGSCCSNICNLVPLLDNELQMLQNILDSLKSGNRTKAASLLDDYIALLKQSYRPEPERW